MGTTIGRVGENYDCELKERRRRVDFVVDCADCGGRKVRTTVRTSTDEKTGRRFVFGGELESCDGWRSGGGDDDGGGDGYGVYGFVCVCAKDRKHAYDVCVGMFIIAVLLFLFLLYTLSRMGAAASREVFLIFVIEPLDLFPPHMGPIRILDTRSYLVCSFIILIRNNSIGRPPDARCPRERTVCDIIDYTYYCNVVIFLQIIYNLLYYAPYRAVTFQS